MLKNCKNSKLKMKMIVRLRKINSEKELKKKRRKKMKIKINCCFLSNRGNGEKCKLGPRIIRNKLSDCVFKKNGISSSFTVEQKKEYLTCLAIKCKQWHERKNNKIDHFFSDIYPQLEKIYEQFEFELNQKT